jgi:hypothetical protein
MGEHIAFDRACDRAELTVLDRADDPAREIAVLEMVREHARIDAASRRSASRPPRTPASGATCSTRSATSSDAGRP